MSLTTRGQHPQEDPCRPWLIEATQDVVFRSAVKAPAIAERMGVSESLLYAWATPPDNRSHKHYHLPVYRLVALTLASGNYALLDLLEHQVGRGVPATCERHEGTVEALGLQTLARMGEFLTHLTDNLVDGVLTPQELTTLRPCLGNIRRKIDLLERMARGEETAAS